MTLLMPASLKVPDGPPTNAPSLAGGSVARRSWANCSPMKGPVSADGSPAGGEPEQSRSPGGGVTQTPTAILLIWGAAEGLFGELVAPLHAPRVRSRLLNAA